jgi:hypothetical protein
MATGGPGGYAGPGLQEAHVLQELGVPDKNVAQVMALLRGACNEVRDR